MAIFHSKKHNMNITLLNKTAARPVSPPRNLILCLLDVDDHQVNIYIEEQFLKQLEDAGVIINKQ